MKKTCVCIVLVLLLSVSMTVPALALNEDAVPSDSVELMFARLQLAQEQEQEQAMAYRNETAVLQEKQKQASDYLLQARQAQIEAVNTGQPTLMSAELAAYMDENGLAYDTTGGDLAMTAEEWNVAIASLERWLESINLESQTLMVYLQDFIGQYNSGLQQPDSGQSPDGLSRGQSMYGDSGAGLTVTALVMGLVLGCLMTLAVQKFTGKKKS